MGLASNLCSPFKVVCTKGVSVGDDSPTKLCTQAMAYTASSAIALDMVVLAKYCKYKTIWCATAGMLHGQLVVASPFIPTPECSEILGCGTFFTVTHHHPW